MHILTKKEINEKKVLHQTIKKIVREKEEQKEEERLRKKGLYKLNVPKSSPFYGINAIPLKAMRVINELRAESELISERKSLKKRLSKSTSKCDALIQDISLSLCEMHLSTCRENLKKYLGMLGHMH